MRLLLDTHALIWWLAGDRRLSQTAIDSIDDESHDVLVSAVSAFEVATKYRLGKLSEAAGLALDFDGVRRQQGFGSLPITIAHAVRAGALSGAHKDPFDRLLIAQALVEDLVLVSNEVLFDSFGVQRLW